MSVSPGGKQVLITRSQSGCRLGEHCGYSTAQPAIKGLVQEKGFWFGFGFFPRKLFTFYNPIPMTENHSSLRQRENSSVPLGKIFLFERQRCYSNDFNGKMCYSSYLTSCMTNITL